MRTDTLERAYPVAHGLLDDMGFMSLPAAPWPLGFTKEDALLATAMAYTALLQAIAKQLDEDPTDLFETLQDFINANETEHGT